MKNPITKNQASFRFNTYKSHALIFSADDYFYVDLLKGSTTPWPNWYGSSKTWTWATSGTAFPASDADQNWDGIDGKPFVVWIDVSYTLFGAENCSA